MRKIAGLLLIMLFNISVWGQGSYEYFVDLTYVENDKVQVNLVAPSIGEKEATFYMPVIIPGTYAIADYGRFVSGLKAFDKKGKELKVTRKDDNTWSISKANKLATLSYWVEDSWDFEGDGPDVFEPAGTNIEEGRNFVINSAGFFGYFKGMKEMPLNIHIIRDESMYGGTGLLPAEQTVGKSIPDDLIQVESEEVMDSWKADNYDHLVDSPLMYAVPDTSIIRVGNTEVLITSFSPNKLISSGEIANTIRETLMAQEAFLDGKLPVEKYAFIFYFIDKPVITYGALEHSYSSFYYMPEEPISGNEESIRDIAAHEFFHIITPLTIHSEEIHRFDFNDPKMSRHLWLYEGVTEYFAGLVQVKYGLIDIEDYVEKLRRKLIYTTLQFNDSLAFTELSLGALDTYEDQYQNVYEKGALIGMCLDLKLLSLSEGTFGLRDLILKLSESYGKGKYFDDEKLFDIITELSYPEIREFFSTYVEQGNPIPFEDFLALAGIEYLEEGDFEVVTLGIGTQNIGVDMEAGKLMIQNQDQLNAFGKELGLRDNDLLLEVNDQEIPMLGPGLQEFFDNIRSIVEAGKEFSMTVERENEEGTKEKVRLAAINFPVKMPQQFIIVPMENPTDAQVQIRRAWLSAY